jgi:hypothetical protein
MTAANLAARADRVRAIAVSVHGRVIGRAGNVVEIEIPADVVPGLGALWGMGGFNPIFRSQDTHLAPRRVTTMQGHTVVLRKRHGDDDILSLHDRFAPAGARHGAAAASGDHRADTTVQRIKAMSNIEECAQRVHAIAEAHGSKVLNRDGNTVTIKIPVGIALGTIETELFKSGRLWPIRTGTSGTNDHFSVDLEAALAR